MTLVTPPGLDGIFDGVSDISCEKVLDGLLCLFAWIDEPNGAEAKMLRLKTLQLYLDPESSKCQSDLGRRLKLTRAAISKVARKIRDDFAVKLPGMR